MSKKNIIITSLNGRELYAVERERVSCDLTIDGIVHKAEIEVRGNTSSNTNKKGYNVRFEKKVSIFGMSARKHWVFIGEAIDKSYVRNQLVYKLGENLTVVSPPIKNFIFQVTEPKGAFFWGYYMVTYKPTIEDIGCDAIIQFDRPNPEKNLFEPYPGSGVAALLEDWNPEKYDSFEEAKKALAPLYENAALKDFDFSTFVDYFLINELSSNSDAYVYSAYTYVRDGKIYAGFLWDYHIAFGNSFSIYEPYNYSSHFWYGKLSHLPDVWRYYHNFKYVCSEERLAPTSFENYTKPGNEKLYDAITKNVPNKIHFSANCVDQKNISAWMMLLVQDDTFIKMVQKRWTHLRCNLFSYKNISKIIKFSTPSLKIVEKDIKNWYQNTITNVTKVINPIDEPLEFYEQTVCYLLFWIRKRLDWLDTAIEKKGFITSKQNLNNWDDYWTKLNRNDYPLIPQRVSYKGL
jgi:hypothetical protein